MPRLSAAALARRSREWFSAVMQSYCRGNYRLHRRLQFLYSPRPYAGPAVPGRSCLPGGRSSSSNLLPSGRAAPVSASASWKTPFRRSASSLLRPMAASRRKDWHHTCFVSELEDELRAAHQSSAHLVKSQRLRDPGFYNSILGRYAGAQSVAICSVAGILLECVVNMATTFFVPRAPASTLRYRAGI